MKKIIMVIVLGLFACFSADAQFEISVNGGPSLTTFGGSDAKQWGAVDSDPQMILRYAIGLVIAKAINDRMYARLGLQYGAKGTRFSGTFETVGQEGGTTVYDIQYTKHLGYLDIPIMFQYYLLAEKLSILAGFQPSLLLTANVLNNQGAQDAFNLPEKENVKEYYQTFDLAFLLGVNYLLTQRIALQLLYQHGLVKIVDLGGHGNGDYGDYAVFNRVLNLSLVFLLTKKTED